MTNKPHPWVKRSRKLREKATDDALCDLAEGVKGNDTRNKHEPKDDDPPEYGHLGSLPDDYYY